MGSTRLMRNPKQNAPAMTTNPVGSSGTSNDPVAP
jgi:hypothetical protein